MNHNQPCPVCAAQGAEFVYKLKDVPCNSVRLCKQQSEALSIPKGDIHLALCQVCGLAWNTAFDASRVSYDHAYEETQAHSPQFTQFHQWLADELHQRLDLRNKTVLEIGCGKGEFLQALSKAGAASLIGYDPGFDSARAPREANIRCYSQFYPPQQGAIPSADVVLSKMTLEHIANPLDLLNTINRNSELDTQLVVLVPAQERIFDEAAFWDIYYEHCNYFSASSLITALHRTGFELSSIERCFGDQYWMLIARKVALTPLAVSCPKAPNRIDLGARLIASVAQYERTLRARKILIWGAASKAVGMLYALPELQNRVELVDINPNKWGTFLPGTRLEICAPEQKRKQEFEQILIANAVYKQEITAALSALDIHSQELICLH